MDAVPPLHPTDKTLSDYGLVKLDEPSAESVANRSTAPDSAGCPGRETTAVNILRLSLAM